MNNTLTEADKKTEKGKNIDNDKKLTKTKERQQNTTESKSVGGEDVNSGLEITTAVYGEDKSGRTTPENAVDKGRDEGDSGERNTGSTKPSEGRNNEVDNVDPDDNLNTVEEKEPEVTKSAEEKESASDFDPEKEKTNTTVVRKDKGQEEKERKDEQINGKRDPDKFGPNETKLKTAVPEGSNTVEIFELEMTKNNTATPDSRDTNKENNTVGTSVAGRKIFPTRVNVTQFTLYRAEEETVKPKEKFINKNDETGGDSLENTAEMETTKEEEEEKKKEREINQSFAGKRLIEKYKHR